MNPELMQRLPDLTGLKNEVIIPGYSRNVYDHAIRMLGVSQVLVSASLRLRTSDRRGTSRTSSKARPVSLRIRMLTFPKRGSRAGRLGTFVLFFVLAFGMFGFIAKNIIAKLLDL